LPGLSDLISRLPFAAEWNALALPAEGAACDPQSVATRLAMYRLLVERGEVRGAQSPFWGYAAQLTWQSRSGRLGTGPIDGWWGACNYSLSVVPYRAAEQLAIVPSLRFPTPPPIYAPALSAWRHALLMPADDLDAMRLAVWRAHLTSIEAAVRAHRAERRAMPPAEQRFARGWVRMVELFGAAGWRTDLEHLAEHGTGALPPRILDGDLSGFSKPESRTVAQVFALADRPRWRWALDTAMWRWMMRKPASRAEASTVLGALLGRAPLADRLRTLARQLF
jgi:hypothetical protein